MPVNATAAPDSWADWLVDETRPSPPPRNRLPDSAEVERPGRSFGIQLVGHLDADERRKVAAKADPKAKINGAYHDHLTAEERQIISQQQSAQSRPKRAAVQPKLRVQAAAQRARYQECLTPEERALVDAQRSGRARRVTGRRPARRRPKTDEIMKDLGAHLTEEERRIIERQLG